MMSRIIWSASNFSPPGPNRIAQNGPAYKVKLPDLVPRANFWSYFCSRGEQVECSVSLSCHKSLSQKMHGLPEQAHQYKTTGRYPKSCSWSRKRSKGKLMHCL